MKLRRFALIGYAAGLVLALGLLLLYGAMEVSSSPAFCGSCHVMHPYYESWVGSSHASIACVDCHIPPGVSAKLRKKYEALAMVTSYFTGSYGGRPWAEVDDSACLECHERRLLVGTELFGEILFDHGPHLTELRRGKKLRCTSCHSQIVQGSHITVTATTCILCHFKGQRADTGTARCTLCHQTPDRIIDAGGLQFDHGDVARFGMACPACHTAASATGGGVPRERCRTCHNQPQRLAEYENGDFLHRTHITEHKVECTHCHLEIEHMAPHHVEATSTECSACHGSGHSPQRNLYAGVGGKGVAPMPDVMYEAGVRCEACHIDDEEGATRVAGEVACMSCHGPAYRRIYHSWQATLGERTSTIRQQLDATESLLGSTAPAVLADASANLSLVERGRGVHNVPYSLALLEAAHHQLNEARVPLGSEPLELPWKQVPYPSRCLSCHLGAESTMSTPFGKTFRHETHVVDGAIVCEACHRSHEERDASGGDFLKVDASGCNSCHHGTESDDCLTCHGQINEQTYPIDLGNFAHEVHVEMMEIACIDCHGEGPDLHRSADRDACIACH